MCRNRMNAVLEKECAVTIIVYEDPSAEDECHEGRSLCIPDHGSGKHGIVDWK